MSTGNKIPAHVAVIMDGNGRWARNRGMDRIMGHAGGVESVRAVVRSAVRRGVRYLTLYAFSSENWGRPQEEVGALMELLCKSIVSETPELIEQGVSVKAIGGRDRFSPEVLSLIEKIEKDTAQCDRLTLVLAIDYSSKNEISGAVRNIARRVAAGKLAPEDITPREIARELLTAAWPDPDLLIRTGGEQRLSNFLLWQLAYAEFYFTTTMWPDFRDEDFDLALETYARRQRKFGLINEEG